MSLLRHDGSYTFYQIEEYQSKWDRWVCRFGDKYYLKEYEFGQQSSCGDCWQRTGVHGIFDLEYAQKYCRDLNKALKDGQIGNDVAKVTEFRIVKVEVSQAVTPLEYVEWLDEVVVS